MRRRTKIQILVPLVIIMFVGAYGRHRYDKQKSNVVGYLTTKSMDEISGIAASGIVPNLYYVHNDSGDTSRFFAISPTGQLKSTIYYNGELKTKHGVQDCEDIAVGPGPAKGKSYVYLGDIGDNHGNRPCITIYRFEENPAWEDDSLTTAKCVSFHLKYPDGPRDAETMMVDPIEKLFYIVSKRQDSVTVYTAPLKFKPKDTVILTKRCKLFFPGLKLFKWITAGDISKDGQQVLIKSYVKVYYWKRENNEPIWQTIKRSATLLPYIQEKQGEAVGFTPDGKGYYTTSEGIYSPIYYYKIPGA